MPENVPCGDEPAPRDRETSICFSPRLAFGKRYSSHINRLAALGCLAECRDLLARAEEVSD